MIVRGGHSSTVLVRRRSRLTSPSVMADRRRGPPRHYPGWDSDRRADRSSRRLLHARSHADAPFLTADPQLARAQARHHAGVPARTALVRATPLAALALLRATSPPQRPTRRPGFRPTSVAELAGRWRRQNRGQLATLCRTGPYASSSGGLAERRRAGTSHRDDQARRDRAPPMAPSDCPPDWSSARPLRRPEELTRLLLFVAAAGCPCDAHARVRRENSRRAPGRGPAILRHQESRSRVPSARPRVQPVSAVRRRRHLRHLPLPQSLHHPRDGRAALAGLTTPILRPRPTPRSRAFLSPGPPFGTLDPALWPRITLAHMPHPDWTWTRAGRPRRRGPRPASQPAGAPSAGPACGPTGLGASGVIEAPPTTTSPTSIAARTGLATPPTWVTPTESCSSVLIQPACVGCLRPVPAPGMRRARRLELTVGRCTPRLHVV